MTTRTIDGQTWRDFNNNGAFEPVPQTTPHSRIAQYHGGGFDLWVYRYALGNRRNCIGNFKTFKQAVRAAA